MTMTVASTWQPFHDEPLFVPELLLGYSAVPDRLADQIVSYLTAVTETRTAPLHTCTAFNALHFGFDLDARGYRAEVLTPELFVPVAAQQHRTVLPVGTFVHLDRGGRRSLMAEVVARYGADPTVDATDGWAPAALSGAPPGTEQADGTRTSNERIILDVQAFGAINAADYGELSRLRRQVLDSRGHLTGPVTYPAGIDSRDDIALYAAYLLGPGRPLLLGGPLGGLLTDPSDHQVLTAALHQALDTIDRLLDTAPGLRRWNAYTISRTRYQKQRSTGWPGLPAMHIDDVTAILRRAGSNPRYTGIWPLLTSHTIDDTTDPLELAGAAAVIVHTNLATADLTSETVDGLLPGGVHLRLDDLWQAGGLWRTQREPIPSLVLATDPRTPLGLGHLPVAPEPQAPPVIPLPAAPTAPPTDSNPPTAQTNPADDTDPSDTEMPAGPGTPANVSDKTIQAIEAPQEAAEADHSDLVVVRDSLIVFTAALRESHWEAGTLPLPKQAVGILTTGPLIMQVHHDGDTLADDEQIQQIHHDGTTLAGINWPFSFYAGIKITIAAARHATRLSATTKLLDQPLPYGDEYRWDADSAILAASLGAEQPLPPPATTSPPLPSAGTSPRHQGVPQLDNLIITVLQRHGALGTFGARRLTGPQLLAALFGPDLVAPPLMWEVIYTCDRMTDAGKLTREPGTSTLPGSTGPDVFTWWPDDTARRNAQQNTARDAVLAGQVREHWVPPFQRALQPGHQASDAARAAYAAWKVRVHGPDADTRLPDGYTFVRGQLRGAGGSVGLLSLAAEPQTQRA